MREEIEKLFEAMALGELDPTGRERLRELASAAPALEARLREELAIEMMLAGLGPNHAPAGLAASVFERLDAEPAVKTVDISRAVQRTFTGRRTGFPWIPMNYLRWASAAAAVGLVVFEVGLLVVQHHSNELEPGRNYAMNAAAGRALKTPAAQLSFEDINGDAKQAAPDRMLAMQTKSELDESTKPPLGDIMSNAEDAVHGMPHMPTARGEGFDPESGQSMNGEVLRLKSSGDQQVRAANPAMESAQPSASPAASAPPEVTPEAHEEATEVPESVSVEPAGPAGPMEPERMIAAASTPVATPTPEVKAKAKSAGLEKPRERVLERQVALRMPLATATGGMVRIAPASDLGGLVNGLKGVNGPEPVKQALADGRVVRPVADRGDGKAVSLREVEMAIAVAGGDIVSRERMAGATEGWKITARMTPAALGQFLDKYSAPMNAKKEEAAVNQPDQAKAQEVKGERRFDYTVDEGRNLLWTLGFEAGPVAADRMSSGSQEPATPLSERPQPRPDQKINVIIQLGGGVAAPVSHP